jgi:hypothetical protein
MGGMGMVKGTSLHPKGPQGAPAIFMLVRTSHPVLEKPALPHIESEFEQP